uniref:Fungal lipase-type domain-containing protein n=1 Tax=Ditylum brightwellii TaxID=49249 RepID=A0A7S4VR19_9STRA
MSSGDVEDYVAARQSHTEENSNDSTGDTDDFTENADDSFVENKPKEAKKCRFAPEVSIEGGVSIDRGENAGVKKCRFAVPEDEPEVKKCRFAVPEDKPDVRRPDIRPIDPSLDAGEIEFLDHHSLRTPSCAVRFGGTSVHVYPQRYSQLLLEEREENKYNKREITVKRMSDVSSGLVFLRIVYTLASLFIIGFLFAFVLLLLFHVVLGGLVTELGLTSDMPAKYPLAVAVILSLPTFVNGCSTFLVIAFSFASDTWGGNELMKYASPFSVVVTEWIAFFVYLGIPVLVGSFSLITSHDDWYQNMLLTWFGCILVFAAFYAVCVVYYEVRACFMLARELDVKYECQEYGDGAGVKGILKRAILLRQVHRWSGSKVVSYIARGNDAPGKSTRNVVKNTEKDKHATAVNYDLKAYVGLALAKAACQSFVKVNNPPVRLHSIDEARGVLPVNTSLGWGLEKIYCRNRDQRRIDVVKGPGSISKSMAYSNFVCAIFGRILIVFAIISFLVWMDFGMGIVLVVSLIIVIKCSLELRREYAVFVSYKSLSENRKFEDVITSLRAKAIVANNKGFHKSLINPLQKEELEELFDEILDEENTSGCNYDETCDENEGFYNVKETFRVTRPTAKMCWFFFVTEIMFFFFVPLITFLSSGFVTFGWIFILIGAFSGMRRYLSASVLLEELGTLDLLARSVSESNLRATVRSRRGVVSGRESSVQKWTEMHRISDIIGTISQARSKKVLRTVLFSLLLFFIAIIAVAIATANAAEDTSDTILLRDFKYDGVDNLRYPACVLQKEFLVGGDIQPIAIDYAFASQNAYKSLDTAQDQLDLWFGVKNAAVYNETAVETFKKERGFLGSRSVYGLVEFPSVPGFAVIVVRGTKNAFDFLTDIQIYGAAALLQLVRFLLPAGDAWTPILHRVASFMNILENSSLTNVTPYRETTEFIKYLKEQGRYKQLHITGHSLGGGIAMISGAQTETPAIAISGPNLRLSRLTFQPPVSEEAVNIFTLNYIPRRDIVPMIDDRGDLVQQIQCNTGVNNPFGCHLGGRTVCQLMHDCGSGDRSIPCFCVEDYGFPEPTPRPGTNRTYAEACIEQVPLSVG